MSDPTEHFFQLNLHKGCVYSYMKYAEAKLREEEQRALKYLETNVAAIVTTGWGNDFNIIKGR